MENGLLYILAFSAMAIALFACVLPQAPLYTEITGIPSAAEEYDFFVKYNGTNYYAVAVNGSTFFNSSDLASTLQDCLDESPCRIMLDFYGNHTISRRIVMERGSQYIYGKSDSSTSARSTNLVLANGVNSDMFLINGTVNADYYTIARLWIAGNDAQQTAGSGIRTTGSPVHVELDYVVVTDAKEYGFNLAGGQILYMTACAAGSCGSGGFLFQAWTYKAVIKQCWAFENPTNFHFNNVQDMEIYGLKAYSSSTYNGVFLESCKRLKFYGLDSELNKNAGVKFYGSQYISVYGGIIRNNGQQANNTYNGVEFAAKSTTYSTYNNLYGLMIYSDVAKLHAYGVRELDANENYNLVDGCVVYGSGVANVGLQGVNSVQDNVR